MNNFKVANEMLDIEDTARWLGLSVNNNHYTSCVFHNERTPSMKLYKNTFRCYGCSSSGDSISLTARVLNISPYEALETINQAFNLGLELGKPVSYKNIRESKAIQKKQANYRTWYSEALIEISDYIRLCYDVCHNNTIEECYREKAEAERKRVEGLQDRIMETDPEEAFRLYRKEVEAIDGKLQRKKQLEEYSAENRADFPLGATY